MPAPSDVVLFHGHHGHEFMAHMHDVATVILVTAGAVEIEVDGTCHRVRAGDLVAIGAWQVHAARPLGTGTWTMRSMHLPATLLATADPARGERYAVFPSPVVGERAQARLFRDWHRSCEASVPGEQHWACLEAFARSLLANAELRDRACVRDTRDAPVARARSMIERTVFENVPIDDIAEAVGLSAFALIRQFRQEYGTSPHAWRMQARANTAAHCLRTQASLTDTAGACGFFDQSHMARVFKKVFGVTPGQYRHVH